jgi:[acyl-carrier-protein] S-malonyltransferase
VNKAIELARESGGEAVNLAVSGPFHSSLMKPAQQRLSEELYKVKINQPQIPIVANSKGRFVHSSQEVREGLIEQLVKPILWCDSVEAIIDFGVSICIEAGPKRVLSGLVRRINKDLERLNVEDSASLDRTVDYLNNLSRGV